MFTYRTNIIKCGLIILIVLLSASGTSAQNMDANQIRHKMVEIRRNTNWDNPDEVKKANKEIRELARQLMMTGQNKNVKNDNNVQDEMEENAEYKMKLFNQMTKISDKGRDADILLAEPLREEIVQNYKDDEATVDNPEFLDKMTTLCIDMSQPQVQKIIDVMDKYNSVKVLIIMSSKFPVPVNLIDILSRAANYPLEELYIFNFKVFVTSIPQTISIFKNLRTLSLFNNQIKNLPEETGTLIHLRTLDIDLNPVSTILPVIKNLYRLENLGIAKTNISQEEIDKIKKQLQSCKIQ